MLYNEKRYNDVIRVWEDYYDRGVIDQKFPRDVVLLVMASLYHIVI